MNAHDSPSVADRLAIRDLIDAYSNAVNHRDWARLGELFIADGVWITRGTGKDRDIQGSRDVVAAISAAVGRFEMLVQSPSAPCICLQGDRATATSALQETVRVNPEYGLTVIGTYYDDLVRTPEGWKFARRRFQATYIDDTVPFRGKLIRSAHP